MTARPPKASKGKVRRTSKRPALSPPVDLATERRIAGKMRELRALIDTGAVDPARTRAMLAGELETRPMADDEAATSLRLPASLLARADALATGGGVSRSALLRRALEWGIAALEDEAHNAPTAPADILAELDRLRARVLALTKGAP